MLPALFPLPCPQSTIRGDRWHRDRRSKGTDIMYGGIASGKASGGRRWSHHGSSSSMRHYDSHARPYCAGPVRPCTAVCAIHVRRPWNARTNSGASVKRKEKKRKRKEGDGLEEASAGVGVRQNWMYTQYRERYAMPQGGFRYCHSWLGTTLLLICVHAAVLPLWQLFSAGPWYIQRAKGACLRWPLHLPLLSATHQ